MHLGWVYFWCLIITCQTLYFKFYQLCTCTTVFKKKTTLKKTKEKALGLDCFDEEIKTLQCTYTFIVANLTEQMIEAS